MFSPGSAMSMSSKEPIVISPGLPEWCNSPGQVVQYSVEWSVERDIGYPDKESPIRSPVFSFGKDNELEACIVLYPRGVPEVEDKEMMASLFLEMVSSYESSITGKLEFVFAYDEQPSITQEMLLTQDNITPGRGWGMCTDSYVYKLTYSADGTKHIYKWLVGCSISLVEDILSAYSADKPNLGGTQALVDYQKLLAAGTFSDVTLVAGEQSLRAHKNILSARSSVFEAMFVSKMKESKTSVVNIVDFDADVIKEMLNFIYTGQADLQNYAAEGLLGAADKYGLVYLKAMCEDSLCQNLTTENVCQIFRLSDLHRAQKLKVKSADFMRRNMQKVQDTDGWKMLKDTCAKALLEVVMEKGKENV